LNEHEIYMGLAIREAELAAEAGEVPVGAVIVHDGMIIGRGRNSVERLKDPTAHAEILAITAAANTLGSWRLENCRLYVTLEPCTMCGGAIVLSRIPALIFGATDPKAGACGSVLNVVQQDKLNHRVDIIPGIFADKCGLMLKDFFRKLRSKTS
jgi:tRNA(adenine34) deaminase